MAAVPPPASDQPDPLLRVADLRASFPVHRGLLQRPTGRVHAVDGVSFHVGPGETLGLVGESGCGKTTVGRAVLRLIPASGATLSGRVTFEGKDVLAARGRALFALRRHMQIIFQDPGGSLDPRVRIADAVAEPLIVHRLARGRDLRARALHLLDRCGMPASAADRFPHEFSGGQRQRIAIARALALSPRFIVCDEPTSALDVSVQAQILNLLTDLQRDLGLSYLFISHDMAVVQHMCRRIAVMHQGRVVEEGSRESVLESPSHPYTRALLAAVPDPTPRPSRAWAG
jgi:ABC-type glutathione transport system ATPase component